MCDMEFVTNVKMAQFIESSVKIQGSFVLLNLMKSLKLFTPLLVIGMAQLWDLFGEKAADAVKREPTLPTEGWRWQYLAKLLHARRELLTRCENVDDITSIIDSLCRS